MESRHNRTTQNIGRTFDSMAKKPGKPITSAQRAAKRRRKKETMIVFINGKQKRVPRPPTIEGLPVDEFLRRNADPIWLVQEGRWDLLDEQSRGSDAGVF